MSRTDELGDYWDSVGSARLLNSSNGLLRSTDSLCDVFCCL